MKVLILANNDVGLYQFRKELIQELLKDNDVIISLPYGECIEPLIDMGCRFIDTPIDRRGINPIVDYKLYSTYLRMIKNEKPNLVITYTIKPNIYGGYACRKLCVPCAINITGLGTAFQKDGLLKNLVTLMYREACKRAKVVFFENKENLQVLLNNGIVKEDQACLLNGAGVNLDHYQVEEYPDGKTTRFLFMGRVMKEKGIDELFEAMKMLIDDGFDCTLDVLGDYEENYRKMIELYESAGWLTYHGYQKDVRPFIKASHCFVLPSWHEGMANTNLECAASGRPVITSNIHGCLEAVEDGVSGYLCEKRSSVDLYEVMKKFLLLSYDARLSMGLEGRRRMEEMFDKRIVITKTIDSIKRRV